MLHQLRLLLLAVLQLHLQVRNPIVEAQDLRILGLVHFLLHLHELLLLALLHLVDLADVGRVELREFDVLHQQLEVPAFRWVFGDGAAVVGRVRLELPVLLEELLVDFLQADDFLFIIVQVALVLLIVQVELTDLLAEIADQALHGALLLFLPVPEHDLDFGEDVQVDLRHRVFDFELAEELALLVVPVLGLLLVG